MMPSIPRIITTTTLLTLLSPTHSFTPSPQYPTPTSLHSEASNLLYQEQEKLIVQRGQLEESFVTNVTPLAAPTIKVRGTGKAGGFGKSSSGGGGNKAEGKEYAKILKKEGVVRIDDVLSPPTADAVRSYLYELRKRSESEVAEGKIQPVRRFANVLLKTNRCDLTIPMGDEIVTKALDETLRRSPVGSTISSAFGEGAILHEFSCLMSDPGSQRQVLHPDTPYMEGKGPVLYTCFVALQDVTLEMGPTVWLPGTNCREAHEEFKDVSSFGDGGDSRKDALIRKQPAVLGTLSKGSCAIFDSRTIHCGTANRSDDSRALFYFSFKNPEVGYPGNPASIRAELGEANVRLGDLMRDLEGWSGGKGCPLIDELGRRMR